MLLPFAVATRNAVGAGHNAGSWEHEIRIGIVSALAAALLFGMATPLSKLLLRDIHPWMLAALLYLGSGLGLAILQLLRSSSFRLPQGRDWLWLAGAILTGGVIGPVLLMVGLNGLSAVSASLLLNSESVFTALLAWFVFKENFDRRIALGMLAIVLGALVLSWPGAQLAAIGSWSSALAVVAACLAWGVDNNLTRRIALADANFIAMCKGLMAGLVNLGLALAAGAALPATSIALQAGLLGFASYGLSLVLFIVALRHLGTARSSAYFSLAPFVGALLSIVLLHETLSAALLIGGALMALGLILHLTERHEHPHQHEALLHEHPHRHDLHHQHTHDMPVSADAVHSHAHSHHPMSHAHPHYPDSHHRHKH